MTDTQAALLRAQLRADVDEIQRLVSTIEAEEDQRAYNVLVAAAFYEAVQRRFGASADRADVIEFVGDLRARSEGIEEQLSPEVAERLTMHALGAGSIDDLGNNDVARGQMFITTGIVSGELWPAEQLDEFVAEVRSVADQFL